MPLLTAADAARALGISRQRIGVLICQQRIPAERLGRNWAIRSEDLERAPPRSKGGRPRKIIPPDTPTD